MTENRYKVATVDEFPTDGSYVIEEVSGQEIAVFWIDGEFYAIANYCVHQGGPLCESGELSGHMLGGDDGWEWLYDDRETIIECPWHSWKFDVTTGKNLDDDQYAVPTYQTEIEDDEIFVVR